VSYKVYVMDEEALLYHTYSSQMIASSLHEVIPEVLRLLRMLLILTVRLLVRRLISRNPLFSLGTNARILSDLR
jgi:hypothetical protein